jgi:hypothetical protein
VRHHPVGRRTLRAVHVGQEHLERTHALRHPRRDGVPDVAVDDPRGDVEREGPLLAREVERHALVEVGPREGVGASAELGLRHRHEGVAHVRVGSSHGTGAVEHLVPRGTRGVVVDEVRRAGTIVRACYGDVTGDSTDALSRFARRAALDRVRGW